MALQGKAIKQKIKAIGNIRKITKTMEMVSVSKMRRSVARAIASKDYALYALELLINLSKDRKVQHSLLVPRESGKILLVIIASNKGLCGSYNVQVSKAVTAFIKKYGTDIECITIGKQAEKIARRNKISMKASFTEFSDYVETQDVKLLTQMLLNKYQQSEEYKEVTVIFTSFVKSLTYQPIARTILPVQPKVIRNIIDTMELDHETPYFTKNSLALYQFEPNESQVLETVVPPLLTTLTYQMMLEAYASEHSSRMVAMKNASDNAKTIQQDLQLTFNKARQASITQEIAEIVAGANALE